MLPLISCIMPTFNRRRFILQAIECFFAQTYENKELIILDDGIDKVYDLIPNDIRIIYKSAEPKIVLGTKRNMCIDMARGELIAIFDDDDWHSPNRLSFQIYNLLNNGKDLCGLKSVYYHDIENNKNYLFSTNTHNLLVDGTIIFKKSIYTAFNEQQIAATVSFINTIPLEQQLLLDMPELYIATIHKYNTSIKSLHPNYWKSIDLSLATIRQLNCLLYP